MITLVQPTNNILPAFNRINYTISSTNANLSGFKYVVKVFNIANELITQAFYDSPANPADSVEFDVSKFVQVNFTYSSGFYQVALGLLLLILCSFSLPTPLIPLMLLKA